MTRVLMLNAGQDMVTARLIRAAKALKLSAQVPPETGRKLVELATSVRLFVEFRENAAALAVLDSMSAAVAVDDDPELKPAAEVLGRAINSVKRHLVFEQRFEKAGAA